MKKVLLIEVCCLCLCGCVNSWKKQIQASKFTYNGDNYVVGTIKNLTNESKKIKIEFEYQSGSIKETGICYENIEPNETKKIRCLKYDIDESYSIKIKNIEIKKH